MTTIAIYSADPVLRCSLEQLLRGDPAMTVVGVADNPSAMCCGLGVRRLCAAISSHRHIGNCRRRSPFIGCRACKAASGTGMD